MVLLWKMLYMVVLITGCADGWPGRTTAGYVSSIVAFCCGNALWVIWKHNPRHARESAKYTVQMTKHHVVHQRANYCPISEHSQVHHL